MKVKILAFVLIVTLLISTIAFAVDHTDPRSMAESYNSLTTIDEGQSVVQIDYQENVGNSAQIEILTVEAQ